MSTSHCHRQLDGDSHPYLLQADLLQVYLSLYLYNGTTAAGDSRLPMHLQIMDRQRYSLFQSRIRTGRSCSSAPMSTVRLPKAVPSISEPSVAEYRVRQKVPESDDDTLAPAPALMYNCNGEPAGTHPGAQL